MVENGGQLIKSVQVVSLSKKLGFLTILTLILKTKFLSKFLAENKLFDYS